MLLISPWNWTNSSERDIFKLQQRIFRAEANGEYRKVRDLARLLVNSKKALLYSIRVVTQLNSGKRTAGLDNRVYLTNAERMQLFYKLSANPLFIGFSNFIQSMQR